DSLADAVTEVTRTRYLDSSSQIRVVSDAGVVRVETVSAAGRTVSVSESAAGASTRASNNYFDSAGQLRASEDAAGGRRYFFYDQNGRVAAEVDATGAVTEYRRDAMGRVVETLRHAERVDTSGWLVGGQVTVGGVDAIRPGWHVGFDGLPIPELNTDVLDGTYSSTLRLEDGRLVVQRGNH